MKSWYQSKACNSVSDDIFFELNGSHLIFWKDLNLFKWCLYDLRLILKHDFWNALAFLRQMTSMILRFFAFSNSFKSTSDRFKSQLKSHVIASDKKIKRKIHSLLATRSHLVILLFLFYYHHTSLAFYVASIFTKKHQNKLQFFILIHYTFVILRLW